MTQEAQEEQVRNWMKKADSDLKIGRDEFTMGDPANDMICFHMQQAVEKYLKAFLVWTGCPFRRTHDIAELIESCKKIEDGFDKLYDLKADHLTPYGVAARYPDDFYFPVDQETKNAIECAGEVVEFVRTELMARGLVL